MIFTGNPKTLPLEKQITGPASPRLTIPTDESARRRLADTDGTARRARQLAEDSRLV